MKNVDTDLALIALRHVIHTIRNYADRIKSIRPEFTGCKDVLPYCEGHGRAVVTFKDGNVWHFPCNSLQMAAVMWYYKKAERCHLVEYIPETLAQDLLSGVADLVTLYGQ
jgi:hypothetical protein